MLGAGAAVLQHRGSPRAGAPGGGTRASGSVGRGKAGAHLGALADHAAHLEVAVLDLGALAHGDQAEPCAPTETRLGGRDVEALAVVEHDQRPPAAAGRAAPPRRCRACPWARALVTASWTIRKSATSTPVRSRRGRAEHHDLCREPDRASRAGGAATAPARPRAARRDGCRNTTRCSSRSAASVERRQLAAPGHRGAGSRARA